MYVNAYPSLQITDLDNQGAGNHSLVKRPQREFKNQFCFFLFFVFLPEKVRKDLRLTLANRLV